MYEDLLVKADVSKAELGRRLGLRASTVYSWGCSPPQYALSYLSLLVEARNVLRVFNESMDSEEVVHLGEWR